MPNFDNALRQPAAGALAILALACLSLTACGGSSGSSTNAAATAGTATSASGTASTGTSSTQSTPAGAAPGAGAGRQRFSAIRECLQKNGVTLPKRTPGSGGQAGGLFPGAGGSPVLPKGMTRAQFQAALAKCGGSGFGARSGRPGGPGFRGVNSPVFKQALTRYAACLRQNGIALPAPNTSGKGPVFSTKGINTASPKFRAATMKCRAALVGAFRRPQGSAGSAGTSG
jgi:hypothetical protein